MFEMTENEFNECAQAERIKHDEKVKELEAENEQIKNSDTLCKLIGEQKIKITELESQNKNLQEMLQATRETRVNADYLKKIAELEAQIEKMKCCENCAFFKDKTYDICHKIKKLGTRKCAFYKMI